VSLGLVLLAAVPWSMALTVVGLWVWFSPGMSGVLAIPLVSAGVGAAAFAGGQLVFMLCVSDRVFPSAARRITIPVESAMALVFVAGLLAASGGFLFDGKAA
jgi:hypothetical protein